MERVGKTLCVTADELATIGVAYDTVKKLVQRRSARKVRRGCKDTPALYDLDSFPQRYKVQLYKRYPDLIERQESKAFVEEIELDTEAVRYYEEYVFDDGRHLPNEKQEEYVNNASILNAFHRLIMEADAERIKQSQPRLPRGDFWRRASQSLPRIGEVWKNSLPENQRALQRKYNEYQKGSYQSLISGKYRNKNSAKVIGKEQEALLLSLIGHYNNLDDTLVAELYNKVVATKSVDDPTWIAISRETVGYWRRKNKGIMDIARKGIRQHRAHGQMTVKRSRPTVACYLWSMDGWQAELLYQKKPKGGGAITYHNRKTVVVVLDPCCDYPVGYAVGDHESPDLIKAALRNAIVHLRWLTGGELLMVNQLQTDHYAIKALSPLYACIASKVTPASVGNAKAKPVERYFNYINTKYCQTQLNWSGKGITSKDGKQPNIEALNLNRKLFPTEKEIMGQIASILEEERMSKMERYKEFLSELKGERRIELSKERYLLNFGVDNGKTNTIEASGLRTTILGKRRDYDCFDLSFRDHLREKWTIKYDPDDLSTALAVSQDGSLRYLLEEKYVQPMALVERKEGDSVQLKRVEDYNNALEAKQVGRLIEYHDEANKILDQTSIKGFLGARLLIDSKGQHKNQRSKELGAMAEDVEYEEQYESIVTEQPKIEEIKDKKSWLKKL